MNNDTYFKHVAKTPYERIVEAFYFFHKNKKSKEECLRLANEKWKVIKNNEKEIKALLEKHKDKLSKRKDIRSFFSPGVCVVNTVNKSASNAFVNIVPVHTPVNIVPDSTPVNIVPVDIETVNVNTVAPVSKDTVHTIFSSVEAAVTKEFFNRNNVCDLYETFFDASLSKDKILCSSFLSLAKLYDSIYEQLLFVKAKQVRNAETKLSSHLKDMSYQLDLIFSKVKASGINIKPSIGLDLLQKNALAKQTLVDKICSLNSKLTSLIGENKIKESLNRRVSQIRKRDLAIDGSSSILNSIKFRSNNTTDLSWEEALEALSANTPVLQELMSKEISVPSFLHFASLLQSACIITLDELKNGFNNEHTIFIINILIKHLPLCLIKSPSQTILVKIHQGFLSSDIIDEYLGLKEKVLSTTAEVSKPSSLKDRSSSSEKASSGNNESGQPSLVSKFPEIPYAICEFIKSHGYKAQEKRRNDDFESCGVSLEDIRLHLLASVPNLREHRASALQQSGIYSFIYYFFFLFSN